MTPLIALSDVKPLLPIRSGNASYDTKLQSLILTATRLIEGECRQTFAMGARTEMHTSRSTIRRTIDLYGDGPATFSSGEEQIIVLRSSPLDVASAVQVWYDPDKKFGTDALIDPDYYTVDAENNRLFLRYPTYYSLSALKVSYTAGYAIAAGSLSASLEALAPDLKQAAILTVMHLWARNNPDTVGTDAADATQGTAKTNSYGIPEEAMPMIGAYRRVLTGRR